jgi:ABC-type transport system involved in multi-copper enzyme maturation permease subunit
MNPTSRPNLTVLISQNLIQRMFRLARGLFESLVYGLPLFEREMLEQAHRGRTYILRVTFACALFFAALFYSSANSGASLLTSAFGMSGQGRLILDALVWMLFVAIYLFGPALTSGVVTSEKERDTLILLYLTRLGPWHVVLEKFLSRLVPLVALLFLALPLLAFAYVFGGVTLHMIGVAIWFLLLTVIQVTSVAVMCSAVCRNTSRSFVLTYATLAMLTFGFAAIDKWGLEHRGKTTLANWENDSWRAQPPRLLGKKYEDHSLLVTGQTSSSNTRLDGDSLVYPLCGPALYADYSSGVMSWTEHTDVYLSLFYRHIPIAFSPAALAGHPILLTSMLCLGLARYFVYREILPSASNRGLWTTLGRWFQARLGGLANLHSGGPAGLSLTPRAGFPIAWRESAKGFCGGGRRTLFLVLLAELPTLLLLRALSYTKSTVDLSILILTLWAISALFITIHSSLLINKERTRQTLDLLLTTPLTSRDIVLQKFAGTRRLIIICSIPLLTCITFHSWWLGVHTFQGGLLSGLTIPNMEYFLTTAACVAIYLPLAGWVALWMGLTFHNPTRATLAAISVLGGACFVSVFLMMTVLALLMPLKFFSAFSAVQLITAVTSPVAMLYAAEFIPFAEISPIPFLPLILNASLYAFLLWDLRKKVLDRTDVFLGQKATY